MILRARTTRVLVDSSRGSRNRERKWSRLSGAENEDFVGSRELDDCKNGRRTQRSGAELYAGLAHTATANTRSMGYKSRKALCESQVWHRGIEFP